MRGDLDHAIYVPTFKHLTYCCTFKADYKVEFQFGSWLNRIFDVGINDLYSG